MVNVIFKILIIVPQRKALCNFSHRDMLQTVRVERKKVDYSLEIIYLYFFLSSSSSSSFDVRVLAFFRGWCTEVKSHSFIFNHFIPIWSDMWWFVCVCSCNRYDQTSVQIFRFGEQTMMVQCTHERKKIEVLMWIMKNASVIINS